MFLIFGGNVTPNANRQVGNGNANTLNGTVVSDTLIGGRGNDVLNGSFGPDVLLGGQGNDTLSDESPLLFDGGRAMDTLRVTQTTLDLRDLSNNRLRSIERFDLSANGSQCVIVSPPLQSLIVRGSHLDDVIVGTLPADYVGTASIFSGAGNDRIVGGIGNDTLVGGTDNDVLQADAGGDVLLGDDGDDQLVGGTGNDTLSGGDDNDTLQGDTGIDALNGGSGTDTRTVPADDNDTPEVSLELFQAAPFLADWISDI